MPSDPATDATGTAEAAPTKCRRKAELPQSQLRKLAEGAVTGATLTDDRAGITFAPAQAGAAAFSRPAFKSASITPIRFALSG
jgi:hypothetical protein